MSEEAHIELGPVAPPLSAEFPELQVLSCEVDAPQGRSTDAGSRERLAVLASRMRGGQAVELRRQPVPAAYRVFFRHIGIDPDATRTPVEAAALARLVAGGHRSRGPLADAVRLALLDTGVPVTAFDAADPDRRAGRLRLVAVRIPGVPSIHVEEALWTCQESLAAGLAQ